MKRMSILTMALATIALVPCVAAAQGNQPEREKVDTTFTTPLDAVWTGCQESVAVKGTLETTIKAGRSPSGQVHNVTHIRLEDETAVGVTSGAPYKIQYLDNSHRSYEFGGADRHVAGSQFRVRVMGPGSGNDFIVTVRWRYRQDKDGNVVVNELQSDSGCKQ